MCQEFKETCQEAKEMCQGVKDIFLQVHECVTSYQNYSSAMEMYQ